MSTHEHTPSRGNATFNLLNLNISYIQYDFGYLATSGPAHIWLSDLARYWSYA